MDEEMQSLAPGGKRPSRSSRSRSRRTSARRRSRGGSRGRTLQEKERALERERDKISRMERDLRKEREEDERRNRRGRRRETPVAETSGEYRSRSRLQGDRESASVGRRTERLCSPTCSRSRLQGYRESASVGRRSERLGSPTFSSKDIIQIIKSIKDILPSQPSNQHTVSLNRSLDHKNIIPEFNPSEKNQRIDVWLKKVNECAKVYGWDEKTTVHFAMQKLTGLAKTWYASLHSILFTWEEWQLNLTKAFPCEQNYGQLLEDMLKRKSRPNEPIDVYYYEKLALLNQCEIAGRRAVDCLIHGIGDRTMRSGALALRCEEPDQLLKFLLSNNKEWSIPQPHRDRVVNATDDQRNDRPSGRTYQGLWCYNCKEKGHPWSRCPKPLIKCSQCDKVGHKADGCKSRQDIGSTKSNSAAKTMKISSCNPCNKFIKKVCVRGNGMDNILEAFVDLGSEVTLIRKSDFASLGLSHDNNPTSMKGFGNCLVSSDGSVEISLSVDGVTAVVLCRIVDDDLLEKPLLIGQTFSEQSHIVVYKDVNELRFLHIGTQLPSLVDETERLERIRWISQCTLHGAACVRAATTTIFTGNVTLYTKVVGKPNEQYIVCGGVYQVKDGFLSVMITPCIVPCVLLKDFIVSRAERVQNVYRLMDSDTHEDLPQQKQTLSIDPTKIRIGNSVPANDKSRLLEILQRYRECFANDLSDLGCTSVTEMKIELSSQRPVVYRPYRLSHHEREKVRTMIDEMLKAGIIRESVSNYASPIILVRKKDGDVRLCVDYRMLNSITVKERYPIPVIEDEIARMSGQAWFITLDLMSGYYQVPIADQCKQLTAFVTPDGQYEYNRMPFGLANAPAVFQRMMNRVLGPLRFNKATVYIDDLLIFGRDPSECLDRLEEVLVLLKGANLKLNLTKCSFLQNDINYLGFDISSEGIRSGKAKIRSVEDFPCPKNVHAARQFLGLVSYFRKFIQGFAQIAHPITKLLKKDIGWEWTDEQEKSFRLLKAKLIERPVLSMYNPAAETELHTDASKIGIGGILLQRPQGSDGSFHSVAYYSRQTTPEEKNFHSYELETLAVVCSLKKFRVYLLGKTFKIVTDCSALRSTFVKRDLIPRIARWWLSLQEFDCSVEYRAGAKMGHVDALSRNPITVISDARNSEQCQKSVMVISEEDWLLTLQLGDSELRRICDILKNNLDAKGLEYIRENYAVKNNKLFRCVGGDKECLRLVVPKGARWQICKKNHDDIGHVGFEKAYERIKKSFWFSKMKRFIKKYVSACIDCAYAKNNHDKRQGLLHPIEKVEIPFHTLHADHLGPFVKSKRGYTHILTIVDSFTKFLFIKPVRNTNAVNAIRALQDVFDTFRTPDRLITDRGSCFTSHAFKRFCLERGTKHVLNAVASPRSNGQVERYNRTILDALTAQNLNGDDKNWDAELGRIQWGLNNTIQKTIGKSPSEVLFGVRMNSEFHPSLNEVTRETCKNSDLSSIRETVKFNIDKAQAAQKRYYDQGRLPARKYAKGDLVKITKVVFNNNGKSTKLMPSYEGPYRVVKILGNDRYKVAPIPGFEGMKNKRKTTVATDRMQPWIHVTSLELDSDAVNDASDEDLLE